MITSGSNIHCKDYIWQLQTSVAFKT